jgi:hypothetical protein
MSQNESVKALGTGKTGSSHLLTDFLSWMSSEYPGGRGGQGKMESLTHGAEVEDLHCRSHEGWIPTQNPLSKW